MLTKGIIQSIDYNSNTCEVRVPVFESANKQDTVIITAIFAIQPGVFNGYNIDDVVIVGFENNDLNKPIVVGKLFLGQAEESKHTAGAIKCNSLTINENASIPLNTKLTFDGLDDTYASVHKGFKTYKSINDLVTALQDGAQSLQEQNIYVNENMLRKVNTEANYGFGWILDDKSWRIQAIKPDAALPVIDIFKVDSSGVTITGNLKTVGMPSKEIISYGRSNSTTVAPTNWYNTIADIPETDGDYVWRKVKRFNYVLNETTGAVDEIPSEEITCLSNASYTLNLYVLLPENYLSTYNWTSTSWNSAAAIAARNAHDWSPDASLRAAGEESWIWWTKTRTYTRWDSTVAWNASPNNKAENFTETAPVEYKAVNTNYTALTQGKSTNYYSPLEPVKKSILTVAEEAKYIAAPYLKEGDCWFDESFHSITPLPATKGGYVGKYIKTSSDPDTYDQVSENNIDSFNISIGNTALYERGCLKQCKGFYEPPNDWKARWDDISGEIVTNKLTANFINAMDITAKKITILDNTDTSKKLFEADGISGTRSVEIAGFTVKAGDLHTSTLSAPGTTIAGEIADTGLWLSSAGTLSSKKIGGSATDKQWAITAGDDFGVTNEGSLYANNASVTGDIGATSLTIKPKNGDETDALVLGSTIEGQQITITTDIIVSLSTYTYYVYSGGLQWLQEGGSGSGGSSSGGSSGGGSSGGGGGISITPVQDPGEGIPHP